MEGRGTGQSNVGQQVGFTGDIAVQRALVDPQGDREVVYRCTVVTSFSKQASSFCGKPLSRRGARSRGRFILGGHPLKCPRVSGPVVSTVAACGRFHPGSSRRGLVVDKVPYLQGAP